ncbi:MAG: hypothetical protein IJT42_03020 [Treponema sp.]|nr:hypothetical protein [Treponema sp.]
MKKNKFFALAASFLALGFGLVGCDSGDGEDSYNEETPTIWAELEGTATTSVTAKWTFETDTLPIGEAETSIEGKEIPANSGEGATLVGGNGFGIKWVAPTGTATEDTGASTGRIQASNKTASLATPENGAMLLLTTTADTNITVRAKGAGAATSARILVIRKQGSDENLVYKNNLYSAGSKFIAFHLKNAPAGTYEIYFNGSTISEIDCNSSTTVTEPKAYSSNDNLTLSAAPTNTLESLIETHTFTLYDADVDVTASAIWTVIEGSDIATVKSGVVSAKTATSAGKVKVRARIGMFYQDSDEFEFKAAEKGLALTLVASNMPADKTRILDWTTDESKKMLGTVVLGKQLVTMSEVAEIEINRDKLGEINHKENGKYTLNVAGTVYTCDGDTTNAGKGEFWTIKDPTAGNGGLAVKSDWADVGSDGISNTAQKGTEITEIADRPVFYTLKFKVTPVAGKSVKVTGVYGCFNTGLGNEDETKGYSEIAVYNGASLCGELLAKKGQSVAWAKDFSSAITLNSETEFTFIVRNWKWRDEGKQHSFQLKDFGLVVDEAE